jgi:hypothetical protein
MPRTIVALFDNFKDAQDALDHLLADGFPQKDVSIMVPENRVDRARYGAGNVIATTDYDNASGIATGAGTGAVIGGAAALIASLTNVALPVIGPVLAYGPISVVLATMLGAGAGAVAGGLVGALMELGVPEDEAHLYTEGIRRGGTLVAVRTSTDLAPRAASILDEHNPIDIDRRSAEWRGDGWTEETTTQPGERAPASDKPRPVDRPKVAPGSEVLGEDPDRVADQPLTSDRDLPSHHSGETPTGPRRARTYDIHGT